MYNIRLLDQNKNRVAIVDRYVDWSFTRPIGPGGEITVTLPRTAVEESLPDGLELYSFLAPHTVATSQTVAVPTVEPKHTHTQVAHWVEIYRGTEHAITGRISQRDIGATTVTLRCDSEEIALESHVTPAQYGRGYDGWDLADVARHQAYGWHTIRVKDQSQWDQAIEMVGVDIDTEPGHVMLAKSGGRYVSRGSITMRFERASVPGFVRWDRIRWMADNERPVKTTMQYRADGGTWSQEIEGALPDEIGVVPSTVDADEIDVRINLYTEDTETEDANGDPVGLTPYLFAVEIIARTEGAIEIGDIPASTGVTVSGLDADNASSLSVLTEACAQAGWEFWVKDGKLNLAKQMGQDRSNSVLFRAGTNINIQQLSEGDEDLCNVLTALGPGDGLNRLQITRTHEDSLARFGPYRRTVEFPDVATLAQLQAAATDYLNAHALPKPAFQVSTAFLHGTEPDYGVGDYVRVADPDSGIITTARIAEEKRSYSASGLSVTLWVGLPPASLNTELRPIKPPSAPQKPRRPSISVEPIPGGLRVTDTSSPGGDWVTTEVHLSTTPNFEPGSATKRTSGRLTQFDLLGLQIQRYYVRLVRVGERALSDPSDEASGIPIPDDDLPIILDPPEWSTEPVQKMGLDLGQIVTAWAVLNWGGPTEVDLVAARFGQLPQIGSYTLQTGQALDNEPVDFTELLEGILEAYVEATVLRPDPGIVHWAQVATMNGDVRVLGKTLTGDYLLAAEWPEEALYTSSDGGQTWSLLGHAEGFPADAVDGPEGVIAVGESAGGYIQRFKDGQSNVYWLDIQEYPRAVTYGPDGYAVAVSDWDTNIPYLLTFTDPSQMTQVDLVSIITYATTLTGADYVDGQYIFFGDHGTIVTSSGLTTYQERRAVQGDPTLYALAHSPTHDVLVAVGAQGFVLRSTDGGITWTQVDSGTDWDLHDVTYGDDGFIIVGLGGTILQSTDGGLTWVPNASSSQAHLYGVASTNDEYLAAGEGGIVLRGQAQHGTIEETHYVGKVVGHTTNTLTLDTAWTSENVPTDLQADRYRLWGIAAPTESDATWFQLRWRRSGTDEWTDVMAATGMARLSGLVTNAEYEAQARGVRRDSLSDWSTLLTFTTPADDQAPPAPVIKDYGATPGGLWIEMQPVNLDLVPDWDHFEVHFGSSAGFTPTPSTLKAWGRQTRFDISGLTPTVGVHVKVVSVDTSGNRSDPAY